MSVANASSLPFSQNGLMWIGVVTGGIILPMLFTSTSRRVARIVCRTNFTLFPILLLLLIATTEASLETSIAISILCTMFVPILFWKYTRLDRKPPWNDIDHLTRVAPPPKPRPKQYDWYAPGVTPEMRMVPRDYKKYIDTYGRGEFWDNIVIEEPSWVATRGLSTPAHLVSFLQSLSDHPVGKSVTLTCYGTGDQQEAFGTSQDTYLGVGWARTGQWILWRSKGVDKDVWPVLVVGENGVDYGAKGLTHYLSGLLRGHVKSSAFDRGWISEMESVYDGRPDAIFKPL